MTKLIFDVQGLELSEAAEKISWRLDPVRQQVLDVFENVEEIAIINADKVKLDQGTSDLINELSSLNRRLANQSVAYISGAIISIFLARLVGRTFTGSIEINPDQSYLQDFVNVDLNRDSPQYSEIQQDILNLEGTMEEIKRSVRSVMGETIAPAFSNLSANMALIREEQRRGFDMMSKKIDDKISKKLDKILKK